MIRSLLAGLSLWCAVGLMMALLASIVYEVIVCIVG